MVKLLDTDYLESIFRGRFSQSKPRTGKSNMNTQFHLSAADMAMDYRANSSRLINIIAGGYPLAIGPRKFRRPRRAELVAALNAAFTLEHFPIFEGEHETFRGENIAILVSDDNILFFGKTDADLAKVAAVVKPFVTCVGATLTYFFMEDGGVATDQIAINDGDPEIILPELYPTIDIKLLCEHFNQSHEKILILYGEPGVGKTSFIKYLISLGVYEKIAYVKDRTVFSSSELWYRITNEQYDLIIFDDIDDILESRSTNKETNFVSNLLSFSDGVIKRKTKIIMTTNQEIPEIDPAITRPGRVFDFLVLPPLSREEAMDIWVNTLKQSPEGFTERFGEEEVTQASLMSEYLRITMVNKERSYMKKGPKNYSVQQKLIDHGINLGKTRSGFRSH